MSILWRAVEKKAIGYSLSVAERCRLDQRCASGGLQQLSRAFYHGSGHRSYRRLVDAGAHGVSLRLRHWFSRTLNRSLP